jgi:anaerobic magnesium-protoporphyrin IX monomethyl ester cyclase
MIKDWKTSAIIVLGGPHVSALPDQVLNYYPQVDYVVRGEGERTIVELAKTLSKNQKIDHVLGISYRGKDGKIHHNNDRPFIEDLNSIPFPAWEHFNLDSYEPYEDVPENLNKLRKAPLISTRGCPYHCAFCYSAFWGRRYRFRSPENVVEELRMLQDKYKVRYIRFFDDSFTVRTDRVIEICRLIRENKLDLTWRCESRVDNLNREMLAEMAKAGCHLVEFGVESGSPTILQNIKKGITVNQIEAAFKKAREAGIQTKAFIMVGSPGETRDTIKETLHLLERIQPDMVTVFKAMVLPNSEFYYDMLNAGKITESIWLDEKVDLPYYTMEWPEAKLDEFYNVIFHEYSLKHLNKWSFLKYGLRVFAKNPRRVLRRLPVFWKWFT